MTATAPVRTLTVVFDSVIEPWELRAFRAAIAHKAGLQHDTYHNHAGEAGFHYRLPLIQYKQDHGHPLLVCLNDGIEELHYFFTQPDWTISLHGRAMPVRIAKLEVKQQHLEVMEQPTRYHIRNWIGLNEDNYATYTRLTGVVERLFLLERVLQNQVVLLLEQLGCTPERPVEVKITNPKSERWVKFKDVMVLAFSLEFACNVRLPELVGLGKGCSVGWGVVKGLERSSKS